MSGQKENIIVLTNYRDIPPAIVVARSLTSYRIISHDPHVADLATAQGLGSVELMNWEDCGDLHELVEWVSDAVKRAEVEVALAGLRTHPDVAIHAWQNWSLNHLFYIFKWYTGLWANLPKDPTATYYIFIYDNVDSLPGWSFLPALMLLESLSNSGINFSAYTYGKDDKSINYKIPDLSQIELADSAVYLLTHIPTCTYDQKYFNEEIIASGKTIVNLESAVFDVPVGTGQSLAASEVSLQLQTFSAETQQRIHDFTQDIQDVLSTIVGQYIHSTAFRDRQVRHIVLAFQAQMVFYHSQLVEFSKHRPSKMLLSDHDTGIHGPLISYAQLYHIPIVMVPHSKRINPIPYGYRNIICLHHPSQGMSVYNEKGAAILSFPMYYPAVLSGGSDNSPVLSRIGILLNELCCCDLGVYYARIAPYMHGITMIAKWCAKNGVNLDIRCRPNSPMLAALANATGLAFEELDHSRCIPLNDFVAGIDICLMYGSPTSGAINFLQKSIPVVNTISQPLARVEASTISADIVPRMDIAETLDLLTTFFSDSTSLLKFRNLQFGRYVGSFSKSHALREFL